ncbi:MAG: hypothetical protein R3F43_14095 [bacterium]
MAVYLNERELGYDPTTLGFPSIDSCMAIVFVTNNGLFGLHNLGGSGSTEAGKAATFAGWYNQHFFRSDITRLYGVTHVGRRGYTGTPRDGWIGELRAFAAAVGFNGAIRGVNLRSNIGEYVEFRKVGHKCQVMVKPWSDNDRTTGPVIGTNNHRYLHPSAGGTVRSMLQVPGVTVRVTNVNTNNMTQHHSERLRG